MAMVRERYENSPKVNKFRIVGILLTIMVIVLMITSVIAELVGMAHTAKTMIASSGAIATIIGMINAIVALKHQRK